MTRLGDALGALWARLERGVAENNLKDWNSQTWKINIFSKSWALTSSGREGMDKASRQQSGVLVWKIR